MLNKDDLNKLQKISVLYVEDDIDIREELSEILELSIGTLYIATNGQEGLDLYRKQNNIDIIISDIKMPIMDGLEMIENIRQENEDIPIIITSAFNEISYLKKAIDLQVDKYINKPINISHLFTAINKISKVIFQKRDLIQKDIMLRNKDKLAIMSELLHNIAHQWRQPLSVISTAATGMQVQKEYGVLTDEKFNETCITINKNAQDLSKTIDSFRNFFDKNESVVELNFKEIGKQCCDVVKELYIFNNIELIGDIEDITILGVKNYYIQIILTILSNAKNAILTTNYKNRYIFMDIRKYNQNITISIKDNGGGISEENISKVFEPYFTTKHQSQGTGLGLYNIYEIVTISLKGTIEVQNIEYEYNNTKYKGAEFKVTCPIIKDKEDF